MGEEEAGDAKTIAKEVGVGLRSIFERIADFFDLFDLSFIVSGATTIGAIWFWMERAHVIVPEPPDGWLKVAAIILASYVAGLVCFAVGRFTRLAVKRIARLAGREATIDALLISILSGHGLLKDTRYSAYLDPSRPRGPWRLYVRLWADLRQNSELAGSITLLRRYWVMAATYDGVAVALGVWLFVALSCAFGIGVPRSQPPELALAIAGAFLIAALSCAREAGRYVEYQAEELVAVIVAKGGPRQTSHVSRRSRTNRRYRRP